MPYIQNEENESMVIKCFQTMMETQAHAAEQTRLLIELIKCGTEFPPLKKTSNSKVPQGN